MSGQRKLRVSRLQSASDVKSELGRLYRSARREEIPAVNAYRLGLLLKTMLYAIEVSDFEQRLETLERRE